MESIKFGNKETESETEKDKFEDILQIERRFIDGIVTS